MTIDFTDPAKTNSLKDSSKNIDTKKTNKIKSKKGFIFKKEAKMNNNNDAQALVLDIEPSNESKVTPEIESKKKLFRLIPIL